MQKGFFPLSIFSILEPNEVFSDEKKWCQLETWVYKMEWRALEMENVYEVIAYFLFLNFFKSDGFFKANVDTTHYNIYCISRNKCIKAIANRPGYVSGICTLVKLLYHIQSGILFMAIDNKLSMPIVIHILSIK